MNMSLLRNFFVIVLQMGFSLVFYQVVSHPDENLSITQFIAKHDYPVETHTIETKDGYLLQAQRIPYGVSSKKSRHVALLVHGLGGSAENYILLGPPDALAFYLADRGYDVWLFNARGTVHSRKHRSLNPNRDRKKFWNFSWHEVAVYDLSRTIDYILNTTATGAEKLFYVGHSMGTSLLFVMLSEMPEMNEKIHAAGLLAPSVYLKYIRSPFVTASTRLLKLGQRLGELLNWYELMIPNSPMLNSILFNLCKSKSMEDLCMDIVYMVGGTESGLINKTLLPIILQFSPSGCATQQAWHYGQVITSGEFKRFDYGKKKNLKLYNDTKPPMYKLANTKIPLALFYAEEDPFSSPRMNEELMKNVPNVVLNYQMPIEAWSHLDYILAYNAKEVLYDLLHEVFKQFEE